MKTNNAELKKEKEWDSVAFDIASGLKAAEKAKNIAIIALTTALIAITIVLSVINYKNDREWRELFGSYDFVSQDGDGINNINSGTQGDLNNGAEGENEKG